MGPLVAGNDVQLVAIGVTDGGTVSAAAETPPIIVVGVDGSEPSRRALRWAAQQAKLTGAALNVVTSWEYPPSFGWAPPYPQEFNPDQDAREALQEAVAAELGTDPEVAVQLTVVEGHPSFVLTEAAQSAALLVVGSRGHGAFAGMMLGSVSEYCASHSPCPVVVVRHPDDKP
jgi:nucleotide-binding universal stress UspA family protein